jgi:flagellar biosynthesis protein FlhA
VTEHVRTRLSRQICYANRGPDGNLPVLSLSPQWEQAFAEALIGDGERRQLALAPSKLREFVKWCATPLIGPA